MPRILLNQENLKIKKTFIIQLRQEYHDKGTPIWDCFLMYMGFLGILGVDYLAEMNYWQEIDYQKAITGYKTMWHRSRRSGKTLGLTNVAVFFAMLDFGFRANKGKVIWRAPYSDQLEQAQDWLSQNPFVMYISGDNQIGVLDSFPINMGSLGSGGKVASKGAAVLIEDEYRDVYKGLKMYSLAGRASDMLAEGPSEFKRFISASTGCRLTLFHDHYLSGVWDYCRHTYHECPWITEEYVLGKAKEYPEDPYFVQQEFEAMWVARGDTAFRNIYIVDMEAKTVVHNEETYDFGDHPFFPTNWIFPTPRKGGVDWNGKITGHYLVAGSSDEDAHYVNFERVLTTIPELRAYGQQYKVEVESGPFEMNIQCTRDAHAMGIKCTDAWWDDITITERFRSLSDKMIIIDKHLAPFTLKNLQEAVTEDNKRHGTIKKTSSQHGLDALMHMIHKYNRYGRFLTEQERAYIKRRR